MNWMSERVHPEILSVDMFFNGGSDGMLSESEDAVNSVMDEAAKFSPAAERRLVCRWCMRHVKRVQDPLCLERPCR